MILFQNIDFKRKENSQNIIFAADITLFEAHSDEIASTLNYAQQYKGDFIIGVIVNDIAASNKLRNFILYGREGVNKIYRARSCVQGRCSVTSVDYIDWLELTYAQNLAKEAGFDEQGLLGEASPQNYINWFNHILVPLLVERKLQTYVLNLSPLNFYSERKLKAAADLRDIRSRNTPFKWRDFFAQTDELKAKYKNFWQGTVPTCQGILFALHEHLARQGVNEIMHICTSRYQYPIRAAIQTFDDICDLANEHAYDLPEITLGMRVIEISPKANLTIPPVPG